MTPTQQTMIHYIEDGLSERLAIALANISYDKENIDVELATKCLYAAMEDPEHDELVNDELSEELSMLYTVLAESNRVDLIDILGSHPINGYTNPNSGIISSILTFSLFTNHKVMNHIKERFHKIHHFWFDELYIFYSEYISDRNINEEMIRNKTNTNYLLEFEVIQYYQHNKIN